GGGALKRLDRRRMIVGLGLERDGDAVAEVDHARVLTRPLQDALSLGGETLQEGRGVLVAAVLRPEQGEDGELEVVRRALEQLPDTVELPVGETEGPVQRLVGNGGQGRMVYGVPDDARISRRANRRDSRSAETVRAPPSFRSHILST